MVTLFSDIATVTSRARQGNGVVWSCAKASRDVQNAARAAEKSVTIEIELLYCYSDLSTFFKCEW